MSELTNQSNLKKSREQYDIERYRIILAERNRQLHSLEDQITSYQLSVKHAHNNTLVVMAAAVLVICIIGLGGAL